jgi:hypothetical protein
VEKSLSNEQRLFGDSIPTVSSLFAGIEVELFYREQPVKQLSQFLGWGLVGERPQ